MTTTPVTPIQCTTHVQADDALLPVVGDLLFSNRAVLAAAVDVALGAGVTAITIDLSQCHSIDSAGMGALVSASKKARAHGCRIRLTGLNDDFAAVLRSTKLDTLFDWDSSADSSAVDPHGERHG